MHALELATGAAEEIDGLHQGLSIGLTTTRLAYSVSHRHSLHVDVPRIVPSLRLPCNVSAGKLEKQCRPTLDHAKSACSLSPDTMTQANLLSYFTPRAAPSVSSVAFQPSISSSHVTSGATADHIIDVILSATESEQSRRPSANAATLEDICSVITTGIPNTIITKVEASHLGGIKALTSVILPIRYSDKFYNTTVTEEEACDLSRVVLFNQQPVGWIRCRVETNNNIPQLYIQALCLLAPYRDRGLATCLLEQILKPGIISKYRITSIYAHVWENNEDALEWYVKRGFRRILLVDHYYRRLRPPGAWIVRRDLD